MSRRWLPSFGGRHEQKGAIDRRHSAGPNYTFAGVPMSQPLGSLDLDRAIKDSWGRVIWVYRAIDARAKNASRLDVKVMDGRGEDAQEIEGHRLSQLLNRRANRYESAQAFRYRLHTLLDLSTKGVFVEVVERPDATIQSLHLLNPQHTHPVPDPDRFVRAFEMRLPSGEVFDSLPPYERGSGGGVLWVKRPHPTDPYQSSTWLEACGLSIDLDYYARLFNRNFLMNDGRPGGVLMVKGEDGIETADAAVLQARMSGGPGVAGKVTIMEGENLEYVDLSTTPRDAQYVESRAITQREILVAAGTPLSVIGDASGRTFDNADAEYESFWRTEMVPELEMVGSHLEDLTDGGIEDDSEVVVFDWSQVSVLQRDKRRIEEAAGRDLDRGAISVDEYRGITGHDPLDIPGTRVLWLNQGKAPVGSDEDVAAVLGQGNPTAGPPELPPPDGSQPALPPGPPGEGPTGEDADIVDAEIVDPLDEDAYQAKALRGLDATYLARRRRAHGRLVDRHEQAVADELAALLRRQEQVVLSRLTGSKARKHTRHWTYATAPTREVKALDAAYVLERRRWVEEVVRALVDVVRAAYGAAGEATLAQIGEPGDFDAGEAEQEAVARTVRSIAEGFDARAGLLQQVIADADDEGLPMDEIADRVREAYLSAQTWAGVTGRQVVGAMNAASLTAAIQSGALRKRWLATDDERTRETHRDAEGQVVGIGGEFAVGEALLAYPGDPAGPLSEVVNCRCTMLYQVRERTEGSYDDELDEDLAGLETDEAGWKAVAAPRRGFARPGAMFDPDKHPRDHRGRFLDVPDVRLPDGTRGVAVAQDARGNVTVARAAGGTVTVAGSDLTNAPRPITTSDALANMLANRRSDGTPLFPELPSQPGPRRVHADGGAEPPDPTVAPPAARPSGRDGSPSADVRPDGGVDLARPADDVGVAAYLAQYARTLAGRPAKPPEPEDPEALLARQKERLDERIIELEDELDELGADDPRAAAVEAEIDALYETWDRLDDRARALRGNAPGVDFLDETSTPVRWQLVRTPDGRHGQVVSDHRESDGTVDVLLGGAVETHRRDELEKAGPRAPLPYAGTRPDSAERHVFDAAGHRHWGAAGAAGVLIRNTDGNGTTRYLMQLRGRWVNEPGTWSTPGGALHVGETPEQGALREAREEMGELPGGLAVAHVDTDDHGGWAYHTVVLDSPTMFGAAGKGDGEQVVAEWLTEDELEGIPLHPGFAASWARVKGETGDPDASVLPDSAVEPRRGEPVLAVRDAAAVGAAIARHASGASALVSALVSSATGPGGAAAVWADGAWALPGTGLPDAVPHTGDAAKAKAMIPTLLELIDGGMGTEEAKAEWERLYHNARFRVRRARLKAEKGAAAAKATDQAHAGPPPPPVDVDGPDDVLIGQLSAHVAHDQGQPKPTAIYELTAAEAAAIGGSTAAGPGFAGVVGWWRVARKLDEGDRVPVLNVDVQGHRVAHGTATVVGGMPYLLEHDPDAPAEELDLAFKSMAWAWDKTAKRVTPEMRRHQRGFAWLKGQYPGDAALSAQKGVPFKSAATGGDGTTTFWNTKPNTDVVAHEFGHNVDQGADPLGDALSTSTAHPEIPSDADPQTPVPSVAWYEVREIDAAFSGSFADAIGDPDAAAAAGSGPSGSNLVEVRGVHHPITLGFKGITDYGQSDEHEDFAESVRLYLKDRALGRLGYVKPEPGASLGTNIRFADAWPARARYLDAVFGNAPVAGQLGDPVAHTEWQKRQRQAILDRLGALAPDGTQDFADWPMPSDLAREHGIPFGVANGARTEAMQAATAKVEAEAAALLAQAEADAAAKKAQDDAAAAFAAMQANQAKVAAALTAADLPKEVRFRIGKRKAALKWKSKQQGKTPEEAQAIADAYEQEAFAKALAEAGAALPAPAGGPTAAQLAAVAKRKAEIAADWGVRKIDRLDPPEGDGWDQAVLGSYVGQDVTAYDPGAAVFDPNTPYDRFVTLEAVEFGHVGGEPRFILVPEAGSGDSPQALDITDPLWVRHPAVTEAEAKVLAEQWEQAELARLGAKGPKNHHQRLQDIAAAKAAIAADWGGTDRLTTIEAPADGWTLETLENYHATTVRAAGHDWPGDVLLGVEAGEYDEDGVAPYVLIFNNGAQQQVDPADPIEMREAALTEEAALAKAESYEREAKTALLGPGYAAVADYKAAVADAWKQTRVVAPPAGGWTLDGLEEFAGHHVGIADQPGGVLEDARTHDDPGDPNYGRLELVFASGQPVPTMWIKPAWNLYVKPTREKALADAEAYESAAVAEMLAKKAAAQGGELPKKVLAGIRKKADAMEARLRVDKVGPPLGKKGQPYTWGSTSRLKEGQTVRFSRAGETIQGVFRDRSYYTPGGGGYQPKLVLDRTKPVYRVETDGTRTMLDAGSADVTVTVSDAYLVRIDEIEPDSLRRVTPGRSAEVARSEAESWERQAVKAAKIEAGLLDAPDHASPLAETTAQLVSANRKRGNAWLLKAGTEKHPLAKGGSGYGWGPREQAKANIAAELASRLNNEGDWAIFRAYRMSLGHNAAYGSDKLGPVPADPGTWAGTTPQERQALLDQEVSNRVSMWATSSGDSNPWAVMMLRAVDEEFQTGGQWSPGDLENTSWGGSMNKTTFDNSWPHCRAFYRRVARVMWDHTQDEFAKAGITHVSLYRGMRNKGTLGWRDRLGVQDASVTGTMKPANSWASAASAASPFSSPNGTGRIVVADVPVGRILGSARTGFGCLNENEFVVMAGPGNMTIYRHGDASIPA